MEKDKDAISRAKAIEEADKLCLETSYENEKVIEMLNDLPPVTTEPKTDYIAHGTDGNFYKLTISNGKEFEQESSGDAISKDAVLDLVADYDLSMGQVVRGIHALPSVEQEPKTGHWIIKDGKEQGYDIGGIKTWYIQIMCDKCGFIKTAIEGHTGQYHYCPNCGAKMFEPQESEVEDIEIECNTCKYDNKECCEEPCKSCNVGRDTHYEPIDDIDNQERSDNE